MIDITIQEYFELENKLEYNLLLEALNPKSKFLDKELNTDQLTYSEVKYIFKTIPKCAEDESLIKNVFDVCFKLNEDEFLNASVTELFPCIKFITDTFNKLIQTENKLLQSYEDADSMLWKQAGGDKLNKWSYILPLKRLGKDFGIYPYDLANKPYKEILVLLASDKDENEINKLFMKLKSKQK